MLIRRNRILLRGGIPVLLAMLLALAGAAARAGQTTGTEPGSTSSGGITAGVRETVLPNGLKVVTKEVHSAPVVSFAVWYKVGSRNEHTGITGVSHLLEHLMFKGTKKYGLGDISRMLFVNGATFNAGTYYDWTQYWETLSSDRLELAMQIESDRMVNSRIDKADLDSEMTVVRSELEGGENDPQRLLGQAVMAAAFDAHPYHWPIIGWRSDVENVPRDAIYQYYKRYYAPNNATVVIVGDFQTSAALEMVRKYFGPLKGSPAPPPVYTQEPPQRGERRVTVRRAGSLPMVMVGYHNPAAKHPDMYALDVLGNILGQGRASRLYQGLVAKDVASEVSATNTSLRDPALFSVGAVARPGVNADRVETAVLQEVERVKEAPVSDAELARARSQIEADFTLRADSVSQQGDLLGFWAATDDWRYLSTYLARIRAVTAADVQRVAKQYLTLDSRTVGRFVPTSDAAPTGPPTREAAARVEKGKRGSQAIPLPKPAPAPKVKRNIARFKLENGISVVVQENNANPTFALQGSLPAGKVFETPDKPGLAQLTAGMLTRGSEKRSSLQFATALENVGASLAASSDNLATSLAAQARTRDFDLVMDLLAEMLRQPAFAQDELERAKGELLAALEEEATDPTSIASRAFERTVYPEGSPLRPQTIDETRKGLLSITRDDVLSFYRRQYGPDRMILVFAGDVKADRVRAALQSRLGPWARNPQSAPIPEIKVALQEKPVKLTIPVPDKSQSGVIWGHAGLLSRRDPDFYAAQILNLILGSGTLYSRLEVTVRDEQGLAYSIFSFFDSNLYPGPFEVMLGTNPTNAQKAAASLQEVIRRTLAEGVTQREVDEAVAYQTGRFPIRLETNSGLAEILWVAEFHNLGPDYIDKYADYYRAVTVAQVNEAAKKHIRPDRATLVIAGPVEK